MRNTWRSQACVLAAILLLLAACIPASSRETDTDTVEAKDEFEAAVEADPAEQFPLFGPFSKHPVPVLETRVNHSWFCPWHQQQVLWESKDVFNPAVVVTGSPPSIKVLYRAEDSVGIYSGTSRIGLAESLDGTTFPDELRRTRPVLYPEPTECCQRHYHPTDACRKSCAELGWESEPMLGAIEGEGGCEDPRVVQDGESGEFLLTYTCYDGRTARLCIATSKDLEPETWVKHGLAFPQYPDAWSKAASIVSRYLPDAPPVAARCGPGSRYYMFWGEGHIKIATSDNLRKWVPLEGAAHSPTDRWAGGFLQPRPQKWDSELVEAGPPAALIGEYIVLIYNGKNARKGGDRSLAAGTYAPGQVVVSAMDPEKVLYRAPLPLLVPDQPFEIQGQVNRVVFVQGLALFREKWLLYYGTADSLIAVASAPDHPYLR
ncbi:glycosyl hydrolase [Baffinella frigidus]|nr:glycosyl hydrolase [Cryptophyta sp. CCMP2293]|mmetsp:Transcript_44225/g.104296  ORF Transcript_44225/g.104296 Transcript_44225/m.104296 type:complete len:432 (+) Transcript_44225:73-1368(+)